MIKRLILRHSGFLLVVLFAIVVRFFFILKVQYSDLLFGDAFDYDMSARQVLELFRGGKFTFLVSEFFKGNLGKSHGILESLDLRFIAVLLLKGPLYPLFLSLIYFIFGHSLQAVRVIQVLSNILICVVLYLIGKEIKDKKVGILAGFLWAIYLPAVFFCGAVLPGSISSLLLILLIYFFMLALRLNRFKFFILGGIFLGLLLLSRQTMIFIWIFLFIALWFILIKNMEFRNALKVFLSVASLVLIIYLPWPLLNTFITNKVNPANPTTTSYLLFRSNVPHKDGWPALAGLILPKGQELNKIYFQKLKKNCIEHPFLVSGIVFKKIYRLFGKHEDTNKIELFLSQQQQLKLHRFIVFFGLVGLFISLYIWQRSLLIITAFGYIVFVHSLFHIEPRYNLPLMPIMVLMSAYSLDFLMNSYKNFKRIIFKKLFFVSLLISISLYLLTQYLSIPLLIQLFQKIPPAFANTSVLFMKNFFILSLIAPLYILVSNRFKKGHAVLITLMPVSIIIFLSNLSSYNSTWREWSAELSNPRQYVYQEISLPSLNPARIDKANLKIDMSSGAVREYDLIVEVNGKEVKRYQGLPISEGKFDLEDFYMQIMNVRGLRPDELRQWFSVALEPDLFKTTNSLKVRIYLENIRPRSENFVKIYGDYRENPYKRIEVFKGPSFALNKSEISHYKFAYSGEHRLDTEVRLQNIDVYSEFFDGEILNKSDLSLDKGIQSGEYRIRLQLIDKEGNSTFY